MPGLAWCLALGRRAHPPGLPWALALAALGWALGAPAAGAHPVDVTLARNGRTEYVIVVQPGHSEAEALAASELSAYLRRMSGANFPIVEGRTPARAIVLSTSHDHGVPDLSGEAYAITVRGARIFLTGGSGRAVLYAAYDFLARLGCLWLAPAFDFYGGAAEFVPYRPTLAYTAAGDLVERPTFALRRLDMGSARSHDIASVLRIIEWMPKLRFNTLMVSIRFGPRGTGSWDDWRDAVVPELKRRGLLLQVGGHGYQNFLDPDEKDGSGRTLFERHPEWFGKDEKCRPSRRQNIVFNTADPGAVDYLIGNVVRYVADHPEIDIFGFWPPDQARWAACKEFESLGGAPDRHARLVARLYAELKRVRQDVRLEIIAFQEALRPPESAELPEGVLVDFCPIGQSFDAPIYDPAAPNNAYYADAVQAWRRKFRGDIGLYSYYRKYAWRSLPNVIPHYIQQDLRWYATLPLQGVHSYAEPADWYTYELNHLALGMLGWDPGADLDAFIDRYVRARYGEAHAVAAAALAALESVYRLHGSIPFSAPDAPEALAAARERIEAHALAVRTAAEKVAGGRAAASRTEARPAGPVQRRVHPTDAAGAHLERLSLMLDLAVKDLRIQEARAASASEATIREMVAELVAFRAAHANRGVFLVYGTGDLERFMRHYTRDWLEVGPGAL